MSEFGPEKLTTDWTKITAKKEEPGRWSFTVSGKDAARAIAYEVGINLNQAKLVLLTLLDNPNPIADIRLDGDQVSYGEWDENDDTKGNVIGAGIFLRSNLDQNPEHLVKFSDAIGKFITEKQIQVVDSK